MKINKQKHPLLLLYIICTLLIPVLHTGGLLCPHLHSDVPHAHGQKENSSTVINDQCGDHDESICQICRFHLTLSQIHRQYQQFNIILPLSGLSDIKPEDFIIIKYRIFSNPSTAPPTFTI